MEISLLPVLPIYTQMNADTPQYNRMQRMCVGNELLS